MLGNGGTLKTAQLESVQGILYVNFTSRHLTSSLVSVQKLILKQTDRPTNALIFRMVSIAPMFIKIKSNILRKMPLRCEVEIGENHSVQKISAMMTLNVKGEYVKNKYD